MAENLTYQLDITGLETAVRRLQEAAGAASTMGANMRQAANQGQAAAAATAGLKPDNLDQAAEAADKLAHNLGAAGDKAALTARQIRSVSTMAAGMALDVAGSALEASGHTKAGSYLQSIGGGAVTGAAVGGMVGGPMGAVAGGAFGAAAGFGKQFFGDKKADQEAAEQLRQSLAGITIDSDQARRAISRIKEPEGLEQAIIRLRDNLRVVRDQSDAGLLDPRLAAATTTALEEQLALAQRLLPLRQQAADAAEAAQKAEAEAEKAQRQQEAEAKKRLAQQEAEAKKRLAQQEADAKKARNAINDAMASTTQADSLSAKGWGSVGASLTSGLETLQRDANALLRDIAGGVQGMAARTTHPPQAVYA